MSEGTPIGVLRPPVEITDEDRERLRYRKALARKKRKERALAGEIRELNIVAMMDMMSIILVFLLKSYSASAISLTSSGDLHPPISSARVAPKDTVTVTVTPTSILVGDKKILELDHGQLPAAARQGQLILPLQVALQKEVDKLKFIASRNSTAPFSGELSVIGDKTIPYDLLLAVLYTGGRSELDKYRFVVLQKEVPGGTAAP